MNLASWIILVILVLIIGVALYFTFKNKKVVAIVVKIIAL